jgi:hypothetical protein
MRGFVCSQKDMVQLKKELMNKHESFICPMLRMNVLYVGQLIAFDDITLCRLYDMIFANFDNSHV